MSDNMYKYCGPPAKYENLKVRKLGACDFSHQEAKAGRWGVRAEPGLHSETPKQTTATAKIQKGPESFP